MEGLIPFVIDAIRKSQSGRGGGAYRCVSSDGSSHGGRHLMDYWELPAAGEAAAVANNNGSSPSATGRRGERSEVVVLQAADARRSEERVLYPRPAAVVAGSAYRRK